MLKEMAEKRGLNRLRDRSVKNRSAKENLTSQIQLYQYIAMTMIWQTWIQALNRHATLATFLMIIKPMSRLCATPVVVGYIGCM
jgi:hypothetical protein